MIKTSYNNYTDSLIGVSMTFCPLTVYDQIIEISSPISKNCRQDSRRGAPIKRKGQLVIDNVINFKLTC